MGAKVGLEIIVDEFRAAISVGFNSINGSVAISVVTILIAEADMIFYYFGRIFGSSLEFNVKNNF